MNRRKGYKLPRHTRTRRSGKRIGKSWQAGRSGKRQLGLCGWCKKRIYDVSSSSAILGKPKTKYKCDTQTGKFYHDSETRHCWGRFIDSRSRNTVTDFSFEPKLSFSETGIDLNPGLKYTKKYKRKE